MGVDESTRQDEPNVNCSSPEVTVSSEYVPSERPVHVPVTRKVPVTGAEEQPGAKPNADRSKAPDTDRHDDVAVHVPTTFPPQPSTSEQDASLPSLEVEL
jgi:hypothetical protein